MNAVMEKPSVAPIDPIGLTSETLRRCYNLPERSSVSFFCNATNRFFVVKDSSRGVQMLLRISRSGRRSILDLEAEALWLSELNKNTHITVPRPCLGFNGAFAQLLPVPCAAGGSAADDSFDGGLPCIMFSFIHGEQPSAISAPEDDKTGNGVRSFPGFGVTTGITVHVGKRPVFQESVYKRLGESAALLHQDSILWSPTGWLHRRVIDCAAVTGSGFGTIPSQQTVGDQELRTLLAKTAQTLTRRLSHFGFAPDRFGLIHADLCPDNLIFDGNRAAVVDFDDCGFGWFLYDFTPCVSFIEESPEVPAILDAWLEGYRRIRKVPSADIREMPTFLMLHRLMLFYRYAGRELPGGPENCGDFVEQTAAMSERYLLKFT